MSEKQASIDYIAKEMKKAVESRNKQLGYKMSIEDREIFLNGFNRGMAMMLHLFGRMSFEEVFNSETLKSLIH